MAKRKELVAAPFDRTLVPRVYRDGHAANAFRKEVAGRVKPTRKLLNILSIVATGYLPWGVAWPTGLTRDSDSNAWILMCGHILTFKRAQELVTAGLLTEHRNFRDEECLAITPAGRVWITEHWPV